MVINRVIKLNRAGVGYQYVWAEPEPRLDAETLETMLPLPWYNRSFGQYQAVSEISRYKMMYKPPLLPCVAYAAVRYGQDLLFLSVGARWPQYQDEYGRKGLSTWYGVLFKLSEAAPQDYLLLSSLLADIVRWYETKYDDIGSIVGMVASEPHAYEQGMGVLLGFQPNISLDIPLRFSTLSADTFLIPERANLVATFPYHHLLAIPCLVLLILARGAQSVGGGSLSQTRLTSYQFVSSSPDIPYYQSYSINMVLKRAWTGAQDVSLVPGGQDNERRAESSLESSPAPVGIEEARPAFVDSSAALAARDEEPVETQWKGAAVGWQEGAARLAALLRTPIIRKVGLILSSCVACALIALLLSQALVGSEFIIAFDAVVATSLLLVGAVFPGSRKAAVPTAISTILITVGYAIEYRDPELLSWAITGGIVLVFLAVLLSRNTATSRL